MARSNPSIVSAEIPTEAQPNNRFTFNVQVRQGGPDPWASDDNCISPTLSIKGWKTPVRLKVDGTQVDEKVLCLSPGNTKQAELSASLSSGNHELEVVVMEVGGNAYDLNKTPWEVNDSVSNTTVVSEDSSDPSRPDATDKLTAFLERIADAVGGTTQQVALGAALAVVLLLVI